MIIDRRFVLSLQRVVILKRNGCARSKAACCSEEFRTTPGVSSYSIRVACSPLVLVLGVLIMRVYYLATSVGCVRQINLSEDGQPSLCQIYLGHHECCKDVGTDGNKADCPH